MPRLDDTDYYAHFPNEEGDGAPLNEPQLTRLYEEFKNTQGESDVEPIEERIGALIDEVYELGSTRYDILEEPRRTLEEIREELIRLYEERTCH